MTMLTCLDTFNVLFYKINLTEMYAFVYTINRYMYRQIDIADSFQIKYDL